MTQYEFRTMRALDVLNDEQLSLIGNEGWFPAIAFRNESNELLIIWARKKE